MASNLGRLLQGDIETFGLIGSCVSRDLKLSTLGGADARYIWRVNTISLMSPAPHLIDLDLPEDVARDARMTLQADVNKTFDLAAILDEDIVLLDFFRDVYGIIELEDGRYITNGIEIQQFGLSSIHAVARRQLEAHEPDYVDLWLQNFRAFAEIANRGKGNIIIFPIHQLITTEIDGKIVINPDWDLKQIAARNIILGHMQNIALAMLKNAVFAPIRTEYLALDPLHEYGAGPFHFKRQAFDICAQDMRLAPERLSRPDFSDERIEAIVAHEVALWREFNASYDHQPPADQQPLASEQIPAWRPETGAEALAHH